MIKIPHSRILSLLFLSFFENSIAQIAKKVEPLGVRYEYKENNIPVIVLPKINYKEIAIEDSIESFEGMPPRFGFPFQVNYNLQNSGQWQMLEDGSRIWQLKINCPNAKSINLLYNEFWLPSGAEFFVEDGQHRQRLGAFTERNNKGTHAVPKGFATAIIQGEETVLRYFEPKEKIGEGIISICAVVHGYKNGVIGTNLKFNSAPSGCIGFGCSGSCHVNVNCDEGDNWQKEKTGVALIVINGSRKCTEVVY